VELINTDPSFLFCFYYSPSLSVRREKGRKKKMEKKIKEKPMSKNST